MPGPAPSKSGVGRRRHRRLGQRASRRSSTGTRPRPRSRGPRSARGRGHHPALPRRGRQILHTNFVAAAATILAAVNRMRTQGHGTVAVLSSVAGERVRADKLHLRLAQGRPRRLLPGLADSLVGTGVRVLVVRTSMTSHLEPRPMATTAEAVAEAIVAGVRGTAATVWVPGRLRPVMAAMRHLPAPYSAGSRPGPPPRADRTGSCRPLPPRTSSAIGSARTAGSRHIEAAVGFAVRMIVVHRGLWRVHGRGRGVAVAKPTTICTDWVEGLVPSGRRRRRLPRSRRISRILRPRRSSNYPTKAINLNVRHDTPWLLLNRRTRLPD